MSEVKVGTEITVHICFAGLWTKGRYLHLLEDALEMGASL